MATISVISLVHVFFFLGLAVLAGSTSVKSEPDLPDIWKVVEQSYDSDVLVTLSGLNPGAAILVDELYNIENQEGVLEVLDHGKTVKMNYYSMTEQSFVVVNGTQCTAGNLIDHPGYRLWGWNYATSTKDGEPDNFIYGPSALLRLVRDFEKQIEYRGVTEIRGIIADHWRLPHPDDHVVDFYFAIVNWTMPYGHELLGVDLRAPLQIRVNGKEGNPWDPTAEETVQEVIYDFDEFKPYVAPKSMSRFLVDEGLNCEGRETLNPDELYPPRTPDKFQVFLEIITNMTPFSHGTIMRAWMYYDKYVGGLRMDVDAEFDGDHQHNFKSIWDLGTGIEYHIEQRTGECIMATWNKETFGYLLGVEIADVIFANPERMFYLDESYVFTGIRETRSLVTAGWTSTRDDITNRDDPELKYKKVVVDYQFLTRVTVDTSEIMSDIIPVQIDLTIYDDNDLNVIKEKQRVNLLHMLTTFDVSNKNPFDVRACMGLPIQRSWLKMTFEGDWERGAFQAQDSFKRKIMEKLFNGTDTSYVRMAEIQLRHDEINVYATLLLLEPAPYALQFKKMEDTKPSHYDVQLPAKINDVDSCAAYCLTFKTFNCHSFYQCKGLGKSCFLSNSVNPKPPSADVPKDCQHFKKSTTASDFQQPNRDVLLWLNDKMAEDQFNIKMTYHDLDGAEEITIYKGFRVQNEIFGDDPVFIDYIRDDFHIARGHATLKNSLVEASLKSMSYGECLLSCDLDMAFDCQTFSYCYESRKCFLSTAIVGVPADEGDIIEQSDCVIISRRYTDDYTSIDGTVYTSKAKLSISDVSDEDRCAYKCNNATDFTCRSFDYCSNTKICDLYTERSIDIPDEKLNHSIPLCKHFERDALVDFLKHPNKILDGDRDWYLKEVSPTHCAEVCEEEPDYGCNGFDYCIEGTDITCFLTASHYSDDGVVIIDKPQCDHYSREYYDGNDRDSYAHYKKSDNKYGPGAMAGLGASMLVISIALTFSAVYVYNKRS